jgi:hypothetical protein
VKKPVLAGVLFVIAFLAVLLYSTLSLTRSRVRVEVCMSYEGRNVCRVASGETRDNAMRAAVANACALIASGVTESQQCEHSSPTRITWLE